MDNAAPMVYDVFGIPGLNANLANILMMAVASTIVFIIAMLMTRNLKMKPTGAQNVIEYIVDFVKGIINDSMDWKTGKIFLPLALTLILYIFISNVLGMVIHITIGDVTWWKSPTSDAGITLTLAGMIVVLSHYYGVRVKGFKEYGKDYFRPIPFMLPFNIIGEFTKVLTLGFRLFGNMYAGSVLSGVILGMATAGGAGMFILGIFPAIAWSALELFIAGIQAFIFTMLSMVYISEKVEESV